MPKMTNKQLVSELRRVANLTNFGCCHDLVDGDTVRDVTALYRDTWLVPLLDEVEKRLVRSHTKRG